MIRTPFIKMLANHLGAPLSTTPTPNDAEVLFDYQGSTCIVTLNRPKSHNAINLDMVRTIQSELEKWHQNSSLKAVIFKGAGGKAFSSGGDMLKVYYSKSSSPPTEYHEIFFKEEFKLDLDIANMKPTQIVIWDGIAMGGGVGLSVHAPIKIATENSVFAMPEARVGLFTDVGSGYFLSRIRNHLGYFLALTATHLKGKELVQVGVADFFVKRENLQKLEQDILQSTNPSTTVEDLKAIIRKYEEPIDKKYPNEELIDELFGKGSVEEIYNAVKDSQVNKEFTHKLLGIMDTLSPMSLRVIFEQLKRGEKLDLRENLKMDMRLMMRLLDTPDVPEGVRCALIDKGTKPNWSHKSVFQVTQEEVEKNFEKLESHREIL